MGVNATHPQKLIGYWVDNRRTLPIPGNTQVAAISIMVLASVPLKRRCQYNLGFQQKLHLVLFGKNNS